MKQLVILSGKGGTGKTSITAAFAHLANTGTTQKFVVIADADVDAANLGLVLDPVRLEEHDFFGGKRAVIDPELCIGCGRCVEICRFAAVLTSNKKTEPSYQIDPIACDGCAACLYQCPEDAIHMEDQLAGRWFYSRSIYGPLIDAQLYPAQENSGKLVTMVKQQARLRGIDQDADLLLVDGPPGIGCPVISAAAGADLALIVTEPTAAGVHDLDRVLGMIAHFKLKPVVCINKADIFLNGSAQIESICSNKQIPTLGWIPFDVNVMHAMTNGRPVTAYQPKTPVSRAINELWEKVVAHLDP